MSFCWNEIIFCKILGYVLVYVINLIFVQLIVGKKLYNFSQYFDFMNLYGFELVGDLYLIVFIECFWNNGSLFFENSDNIILSGILLCGCGGLYVSIIGRDFKYFYIEFYLVVFLVYCKYIVIDYCNIVDSFGIGFNMYDIGGEVCILYFWFENNWLDNLKDDEKDVVIVGGGIYMELIYRGGIFFFDFNLIILVQFDINSSYIFYNCMFKKNCVLS